MEGKARRGEVILYEYNVSKSGPPVIEPKREAIHSSMFRLWSNCSWTRIIKTLKI